MQAKEKKPITLYRHFDEENILLYVGISSNFFGRTGQHKSYAPWFDKINVIKIERFSTRKEALNAEKIAIKNEKPKYNKLHSPIRGERKRYMKRGYENYHFDLPVGYAELFNRWAKEDDRSFASMFRRLIEREAEARGEQL